MKKSVLTLFTLIVTILGFSAIVVHAAPIEDMGLNGEQQLGVAVSGTVTSYFDGDNDPSQTVTSTYGTALAVTNKLSDYTGYTFYCWIVNGVVRTDLAIGYSFTMTDGLDLKAIFYPNGTNGTTLTYPVVFMDANGELLEVEYVAPNGAASAPGTLPTKLGFDVSVTPWTNTFAVVAGPVVTVLQYTKTNATEYAVTVVNGTINDLTSDTIEYNTVATVIAPAMSGELYFHHWEMQDLTVSYSASYSFTVVEAVTLTAYYATSSPADQPRVMITNDLALRSGYKTFIGQFYLPSGYSLVEWGIVSTASATAMTDIGTASVIRNKSTKYNATTKEFVLSITNANSASYRGYLICKNASNVLVTVYSDNAFNVVNGGFETDSIYGWNSYRIWKNESGIEAWQDARVVNDTYFGSNPYGRDGNYNLGVVWDGASWDQGSERMGHLRSSDFILGGSGWISFKLGGGKTTSVAYVSVRKTSDNTEIARFGNPNFNNTGIATAQYGSSISNAEAFLFQYYFDLSSIGTLGDSYYIVISDTTSYDWCVLSADSFITYYASDPTPGENQTATNIIPSILGIDTATNAIVNGYFATNFDGWENVNSTWRRSSDGTAYSSTNSTDSGYLGLVRSSAFSIVGNPYIRFGWGGSIRYDKQMFISVKEVGTNIEVLRFVRRDNLSSKENVDLDNHMLNLSGLSTSKLYYLEFCDNKTSSVGYMRIDELRFVPESEWNSVTSGDRAVSISGIPTNFIYTKPF
ncbi:MAG TPA: hypothetical protein DCR44_02885 [Acholeplasmatales bacterium]|nr:MAG: hypothetical protein A2Y16_02060 [Tenericutes bacterium GWF2_57_13]HAQ56338.1 hypothetical protein [Acholeplasmatales bacterium]